MLLLSTGWDLSPGVVFPFLGLATAIGVSYAKSVRDKATADAERTQLTKQVDILWTAMITRSVQDLHHCDQLRMDGLLEAFEAQRATPQELGQLGARLEVIASGGSTPAEVVPARQLLAAIRYEQDARDRAGVPARVVTPATLEQDQEAAAETARESEHP